MKGNEREGMVGRGKEMGGKLTVMEIQYARFFCDFSIFPKVLSPTVIVSFVKQHKQMIYY